MTVGGGIAALSVSCDSCRRPEEPRRYRRVPRCIARRRARVVPGPRHVGAAPRRDKFGGLRDMSSTLAQEEEEGGPPAQWRCRSLCSCPDALVLPTIIPQSGDRECASVYWDSNYRTLTVHGFVLHRV